MKYLRKAKVIDAEFFDGTLTSASFIKEWSGGAVGVLEPQKHEIQLTMETKYGVGHAKRGYWVVRASCGLYYPCSHADFLANYEEIP